jgi:hypothetical protein
VIYGVHGYKTHAKILPHRPPHTPWIEALRHLGTGKLQRTDRALTRTSPVDDQRRSPRTHGRPSTLTGYSIRCAEEARDGADGAAAAAARSSSESGRGLRRASRRKSSPDELCSSTRKSSARSRAPAGEGQVERLGNSRAAARRADVSANIEVVSIVDRYPSTPGSPLPQRGEEEVYPRAGLETRNLDKRIELMFPVEQAGHGVRIWHAAVDVPRHGEVALAPAPTASTGSGRRRKAKLRSVQEHLQEEARRLASLARDRAGASFRPEERKQGSKDGLKGRPYGPHRMTGCVQPLGRSIGRPWRAFTARRR